MNESTTYWNNEIEKFKSVKRKSESFLELLALAEKLVVDLSKNKEENSKVIESLEKEIEGLVKENKDLRDELEVAWKNNF